MKKKNIILLHIIFWVVTILTTALTNIPELDTVPIKYIIRGYSIYLVSFVMLFYLFYFFISIKYLNNRKIAQLIIFGLLFTIIITIPVTCFYIYILFPRVFTLTGNNFLMAFSSYYFRIFETNIMFIMSGSLLKITLLWYESKMKQKEIEKQYIANELALLRTQINPYFLFNTLNNIKSLINTLPSKAIYSVEKLSEIMSYMLYESSVEKVYLENEINYINNYLDLQKVRYNNPDFIDFQVAGDYSKIMIPPLIFMPFIENAFKYGDAFTQIPGIKINIDFKGADLSFEVLNYIKENRDSEILNGGFSLNIIRRRLDLLFENNYKLDIINKDKIYKVKLNLSLPE
jgi:two-component system, LytTR family, sensor kinase